MPHPNDKHGPRLERWLIPALIVAFCGAAFWLTTTFKTMPPILKRGMQPSDFPQLLLVLLVLLTVAMVLRDPIRIKERMERSTWGTILLFGVFAVLTSVDFFLALAVFAAALSAALDGQALLLPNLVAGLAGLVGFGTLYFLRVGPEEAMMESTFGDAWRDYRARTARLIPGIY